MWCSTSDGRSRLSYILKNIYSTLYVAHRFSSFLFTFGFSISSYAATFQTPAKFNLSCRRCQRSWFASPLFYCWWVLKCIFKQIHLIRSRSLHASIENLLIFVCLFLMPYLKNRESYRFLEKEADRWSSSHPFDPLFPPDKFCFSFTKTLFWVFVTVVWFPPAMMWNFVFPWGNRMTVPTETCICHF